MSMLRYGTRMMNRYGTIQYYRIRAPGAAGMKAFFKYLMPVELFFRLRFKAN